MDWCAICPARGMRITLSARDVSVSDPLRGYAAYRIFTRLSRHESLVRGVGVEIGRDLRRSALFLCTIHIDLAPYPPIKTQARRRRPGEAIDRATERAAWLLARRVAAALS